MKTSFHPPSRSFNPRAPCGARLYAIDADGAARWVSIHAPRVGRDVPEKLMWKTLLLFQSTRPVWGATAGGDGAADVIHVSIHAPRVGRDPNESVNGACVIGFNPRAPCGARPWSTCRAASWHLFQSTRPVWGATVLFLLLSNVVLVSIHAPRVGRDCIQRAPSDRNNGFNPRAPCGARPPFCIWNRRLKSFNPRAPCGARPAATSRAPPIKGFNPRAPCGARLCRVDLLCLRCKFQSTRPVWGATPIGEHPELLRIVSIHAPRVGRDIP